MRKLIYLLFLFILISSCTSSVLDKKINIKTLKEDLNQIKNNNKQYTLSDYNAIKDYLTGLALQTVFTGDSLTNITTDVTYREILDSARQKRIIRDSIESSLKQTLNLFSYGGLYMNVKTNNVYGIQLDAVNKSDKKIVGFKGRISALNIFKDTICTFTLINTDTIAAFDSIKITPVWVLNGNYSDEVIHFLKVTPPEKISLKWHPTQTVFSDGSSIKMPD